MGRRVLFHLTVVLVAAPFVLGWWLGFDALSNSTRSWQVQTFATLFRLPATVLGLPFIVAWVAGPIALRVLRFSPNPQLVPFDPKQHRLPDEGVRWLDENVALLRLEGFELLAAFVHERDDVTIHHRLLEHREHRIVARLEWATHWSLLSLRTVTSRGIRLTTTVNGVWNNLPVPPGYVQEFFPGLSPKNLSAVHLAMVGSDGGAVEVGYRDGEPSVTSAPLEWVRYRDAAMLQAYVALGVMTPRQSDGTHRARWRTAVRCQWNQMWPLYGRRLRARRRRARELLDAHGFSLPVAERKHGKGTYGRLVVGPVGGLTVTAVLAFVTYALLVAPAAGRAHGSFEAIHPCPCDLAGAGDATTTLAQFTSPAAASAATGVLEPGGTHAVKLPDALLFERASEAQLAKLRSKGAVVVPDGQSSRFEVSCTAPNVEDARAIEREVRDCTDLSNWIDVPPWFAPPTPEQARSRRTLRLLVAGLESTATASELDERVLQLRASKPDDDYRSPSPDWRRSMGDLLGGQSSASNEYRHATVRLRGREVILSGMTDHAARETMAVARYVCAKGCQDVRFAAGQPWRDDP